MVGQATCPFFMPKIAYNKPREWIKLLEDGMNLTFIAAGALLLLLGCRLFWLFVAVAGFMIGSTFAPQLLPTQPESVILTISLIIGLLGALMAVILRKFAVAATGFVAGGYIVFFLLQYLGQDGSQMQWLAMVAGGLIGAVMAGSMIDWALILLTGATGAILVTQGLNLSMPLSAVVMLGLYMVSVVVQGNLRARE
jgi:hypothetical protein